MTKEQTEKLNLCRSNEEKLKKLFYIKRYPNKTDKILDILYTEKDFKILMGMDYEEWLTGPFPIFLDCAVEEEE